MKDDVAQLSGQLDDRAAVEAVITREIDAFHTKDFAAWCDCYLHSPRMRSTMMSHDLGLDVREGWDAHLAGTRMHFDSPPLEGGSWSKETDQVCVSGDMAWLTCRARADLNTCMMGESYETWVLERHAGAWKIVAVNVMAAQAHTGQGRRIAVDATGHVVALGPQAARLVEDHPGFVIRDGRLRAVDRAVDRDLQMALERAGTLHGYFQQATYAALEGQQFGYPLVLANAETPGHMVVMITVQDRLTYVDFGTDAATTARVDAAALMFGLSEAQHRVAEGIVAGDGLPAIAAQMGITPATAKTHLSRVYDKTGTRSMTALVRALLAFG